MNEIGYVKGIEGDTAHVVFRRKSGCGDNCGSCAGGCSADLMTVDVKNTLNASMGDTVEVSMEEKYVYKAMALVYGFPLLMLLLGVAGGNSLFAMAGTESHELYGVMSGLMLMGISYFILNKIDKKISKNKNYNTSMIRIIEYNDDSKK
jgi:sigma-E factor negative regulatory protein RseC